MAIAMFVLSILFLIFIVFGVIAYADDAEDVALGFFGFGSCIFGLSLAILAIINFGISL